jgi:predicted CXXCH cytochrome family protein
MQRIDNIESSGGQYVIQKFLLICAAAIFLTIAITSIAKANGGPHGDYTTTTDACAGCHRAHTAPSPHLVAAATEYALCMSCHGASATGANTNVDDGKFMATRNTNSTTGVANSVSGGNLIAGGFTTYKGQPVTSNHDTSGSITNTWGISGTNRGQLGAMSAALTCTSCHNPHGSTNYRMINTPINGIPITVTQSDEGAAKDYTQQHWLADISSACDGCHASYHTLARPSTTNGSGGGYAHRTDFSTSKTYTLTAIGFSKNDGVTVTLPFASTSLTSTLVVASGNKGLVVCETCHLVHGSSSAMTGFANGAALGTGGVQTTSSDSALLRLDNRGVCEACHQK